MDKDLTEILDRLAQLAERSDHAFAKLEAEVASIKEQRYKPYFASMGAFLIIVIGVMGYVYGLEVRLNTHLLNLETDLGRIRASIDVNAERIQVSDDRLSARSDNMMQRWGQHTREHTNITDGMRIIILRLLDEEAEGDEEALADE